MSSTSPNRTIEFSCPLFRWFRTLRHSLENFLLIKEGTILISVQLLVGECDDFIAHDDSALELFSLTTEHTDQHHSNCNRRLNRQFSAIPLWNLTLFSPANKVNSGWLTYFIWYSSSPYFPGQGVEALLTRRTAETMCRYSISIRDLRTNAAKCKSMGVVSTANGKEFLSAFF